MVISGIYQKQEIAIEELKHLLNEAVKLSLSLSISIAIQLQQYLIHFLISIQEFSPKKIRQEGLSTILFRRAMRFFKLEDIKENIEEQFEKIKQKINKPRKTTVKKVIKAILLPAYLLIIGIMAVRNVTLFNKNHNKFRNVYNE